MTTRLEAIWLAITAYPTDGLAIEAVERDYLAFAGQIGIADDAIAGGATVPALNLWVSGRPRARVPIDAIGQGLLDRGLKVRTKVTPDVFVDQDKPEVMYQRAGLSAQGIVETVCDALQMKKAIAAAAARGRAC